MVNQAYCILPFIHLHIDENDSIKPCCYGSPIKQYTPDFDFDTDPEFDKIRKQMLAGQRVKSCSNCYRVDDLGGESYRIRDTRDWLAKLNVTDYQTLDSNLQYYDIRNDNLCNLSCRICYPGASSQIEREHQRIGWAIKETPRQSKMSDIIDYNTVKKVYVAGGEPTVMPEFKKFLHRAIAEQRTDIELQIITNATNLNAEYCELLGHFNNVNVTVSIDGYDRINRYIRWPSNWTTMIDNIRRLHTITQNVSFNVTVSIWNITQLKELIDFLDREFNVPIILMNPAVPIPANNKDINISPFNFPNKQLALEKLNELKETTSYQQEEYFRGQVEFLINGVRDSDVSLTELQTFFEYNDALDASRNVTLDEYIPELEKCRDYLTKQI